MGLFDGLPKPEKEGSVQVIEESTNPPVKPEEAKPGDDHADYETQGFISKPRQQQQQQEQQHQQQLDISQMTQEEAGRIYESLKGKKEDELNDNQKSFVSEYAEAANALMYEDLSKKKPEDLNEEQKKFLDEYKPVTPFSLAIEEATQQFGIEMPEDVEYENTPDGIRKMYSDLYQNVAQKAIQNEIEQYPELKRFHTFLINGGDPNEYKEVYHPDINFADVRIIETEEFDEEKYPGQTDVRKNIVRIDLQKQGYSNEEINDMVASYERSGILGKQALMSKKKLAKEQKLQQDTLVSRTEDAHKAFLNKQQKYQKDFSDRTRVARDVFGLRLNDNEKNEFLNFRFGQNQNSTLKNVPFEQELVYHMYNPESKYFNSEQIVELRERLSILLYKVYKDKNFLANLVSPEPKGGSGTRVNSLTGSKILYPGKMFKNATGAIGGNKTIKPGSKIMF